MPKILHDGIPVKQAYEPPPSQVSKQAPAFGSDFIRALSEAISAGFRTAMAEMPAPVVNVEAPVVNVPKPEVKINSPVYVQTPEVRVPATTVNVPDGKTPVVNIEPATVTLQTNRPNKWHFDIHRDELGRMTTIDVEAR
jgi:hypothetical protein